MCVHKVCIYVNRSQRLKFACGDKKAAKKCVEEEEEVD
jgi:hypothetical protein